VRRIIKLRLLYQEFKIKENIEIEEAKKNKNKNEENNNDNKDDKTKEKNGSCLRDCFDLLGYIAFIMVIATDFLLPIFMKYQNESGKKEDNKKNSSILYLILSLFGILILGILFMPYTIISLISSIRRRYITGDYLYDEQINDHISLMKTVQIICGYSFTIIYCNLYFWKINDKAGLFGKPIFYEETIIPDYIIKNGFGIYMIVKLVIIITTIIFSFCFYKTFVYKNDFGEYYTNKEKNKYDNDIELKKKLEKYPEINKFLNKN
jgi:membrane-associated HD superfamily phosphohydrolase